MLCRVCEKQQSLKETRPPFWQKSVGTGQWCQSNEHFFPPVKTNQSKIIGKLLNTDVEEIYVYSFFIEGFPHAVVFHIT